MESKPHSQSFSERSMGDRHSLGCLVTMKTPPGVVLRGSPPCADTGRGSAIVMMLVLF